jgi:hypothetical protein
MIRVYVCDTEYNFNKHLGDFDIKDVDLVVEMLKKYEAEFNNEKYVFNNCYYDLDLTSFSIELIKKEN